jgi:hypothetical protein
MVIAPAKTGSANSRRTVVIKTLQANKGTCSNHMVFGFIFTMVIIKFKDLIMEDAPAK